MRTAKGEHREERGNSGQVEVVNNYEQKERETRRKDTKSSSQHAFTQCEKKEKEKQTEGRKHELVCKRKILNL